MKCNVLNCNCYELILMDIYIKANIGEVVLNYCYFVYSIVIYISCYAAGVVTPLEEIATVYTSSEIICFLVYND